VSTDKKERTKAKDKGLPTYVKVCLYALSFIKQFRCWQISGWWQRIVLLRSLWYNSSTVRRPWTVPRPSSTASSAHLRLHLVVVVGRWASDAHQPGRPDVVKHRLHSLRLHPLPRCEHCICIDQECEFE